MSTSYYSDFYPTPTISAPVEGSTVPIVTSGEAANYNSVIDDNGLRDGTVGTGTITGHAVTRMSSMVAVSPQVMTTTPQLLTGTFSGEFIGEDEFGNPIYASSTEVIRSTFTSIAANSLVFVIACISSARVGGDDDLMTLRCKRRTGSMANTASDTYIGKPWTVRSRAGAAVTTYTFYDSPDTSGTYIYMLEGVRNASSGTGPDIDTVSITAILGQR